MGWGKGESIIEQRREEICDDPQRAMRSLRRDLQEDYLRPRDRVRLLGLVSACYRYMGEREKVKATIAEARLIPRAGKIARAELLGHETEALIEWALKGEESWERASASSILYLREAEGIPRYSPKTDWGRRQERDRCGLLVTALVGRGEVYLYTGSINTALEYGCRAILELGAVYPKAGPVPAYARRLAQSSISLVAASLVQAGGARARDGKGVILKLIESFPKSERVWRSRLTAFLGYIEASEGRFEAARQIFVESLETLEQLDADTSIVIELWKSSVARVKEEAARLQVWLSVREEERKLGNLPER